MVSSLVGTFIPLSNVPVPGMRHIPPTAGNPPSFAAPTAAELSHAAEAHARTDPKESQNALPRLAFMLRYLESREKTDGRSAYAIFTRKADTARRFVRWLSGTRSKPVGKPELQRRIASQPIQQQQF